MSRLHLQPYSCIVGRLVDWLVILSYSHCANVVKEVTEVILFSLHFYVTMFSIISGGVKNALINSLVEVARRACPVIRLMRV